ncbi:peptidyl-prolyl cis-trans isomerase, cyclophilin-type protein [Ceratobasidium sp. AG-Ba]|nr:peptidyl-prolyl cis-trans isomerase, cyclophilin-type protein [Ceratobasidium sp. AG-Ba]QRV88908.1 peptidyl-prolyl cis-trans isomerase, cyclophilin-type protein [Ceratobasidium sp. AG-Ba]QRW03079.1 peptidyl-prolyl cis-trans isomerase, cyclophilin-type protein [Ceratobasidium sp. AG-Ba]
MALPTNGKVIIETTVGDIEIELWAKETPKTCRNFLALAMEGYYDGVIFHRVVPGFLVQTGDRTGTGYGGESFYGDVFEDEIHPRLRFAHRGLVAMANNGSKNSNDSQFFITLDRADELHGKHTLFGRTVRDTIFNVLKIGQLELGENERPLYPPKIKTVRIIEDPFGDIVPRITAAEKRAQQMAKEAAQRQREEAVRKKGAKKNVALLSFGDNAEAQDEPVVFTKKSLSRPDLIDNPDSRPAISAATIPEPPKPRAKPIEDVSEKKAQPEADSKPQESEITSIRKKHKSDKDTKKESQKTELEKMEAQVRKLARRHSDSESEGEREAKKPKGPSQLELELAKYKKGRAGSSKKGKGKGRDETDVLAALSTFRGRLKQSMGEDDEDEDTNMQDAPAKEGEGAETGEEKLLEVDDDSSWIGHRLRFAKDDGAETRRAEHEYEVIDPRARSSQARMEERERKAGKRSAVGQAFQKGRR